MSQVPPPPPPGSPPPPPSFGGAEPAAPTDEHHFPCTACGSDLRFDPDTGDLKCDHCGAEQDIDAPGPWAGAIRELDFRAALDAQLPAQDIEETRVTTCPNCAAQVSFDGKDHAQECPYCATPVVIDTGTHRHIKPRGLVAFRLDEDAAQKAMTQWLGKLWFAPNGLQAYARKGRRMQGIYVPFWTYDADTASRYTGMRGTVYYVTVTDKDGKSRQVSKVRWTPVAGRVARFFDDVLVLASTALPKRFTDALEPWDLGQLEPYQPEFLAGFRSEGYSVDLTDGYHEARAKMDAVIEADIRRDIGGDRQRIGSVNTAISDVTFKHVLLPVWVAAYKYRGKSYRFVVNGQSGKVRGERPWSAWKIAAAVVAGLVAAGVLFYLTSDGSI